MPEISHWIEQKIATYMKDAGGLSIHDIAARTGLGEDQARRGVEWLLDKGILQTSPTTKHVVMGRVGMLAHKTGLPERRLLDMIREGADTDHIYDKLGSEMGPAIGICVRNGWICMKGRQPVLASYPDDIPGEMVLERLARGDIISTDDDTIAYFDGRPGYLQVAVSEPIYRMTGTGMRAHHTYAMDVEAPAADVYIARTHPLYDTIAEIREAFISLGFDEVAGGMVQSSFWNFDALFTPQDHPARDMQDTFFVDGMRIEPEVSADIIRNIGNMHNTCWGGSWDRARAAEVVLRTHTTCITVRHLAENNTDDARVFSLGRVFRNEKPSYKHLAEFHQAEGIVVGRDVSLRDLMGIQREFYDMIGMKKIKFWPTYFPYTEPSLQSMVYNDTLGKWIELFGMGIFRPEVTRPLGITKPVLAWGGGIERIAMIRHGINDVRTLYTNDMGWLRGLSLCP